MKRQRILFIDRDGTLIREPEDEQIDAFEKLRFTEGMIPFDLRYWRTCRFSLGVNPLYRTVSSR